MVCCLCVDCFVGFCSGFPDIIFVLLSYDSVLLLVGVVLMALAGLFCAGNAVCGVAWRVTDGCSVFVGSDVHLGFDFVPMVFLFGRLVL